MGFYIESFVTKEQDAWLHQKMVRCFRDHTYGEILALAAFIRYSEIPADTAEHLWNQVSSDDFSGLDKLFHAKTFREVFVDGKAQYVPHLIENAIALLDLMDEAVTNVSRDEWLILCLLREEIDLMTQGIAFDITPPQHIDMLYNILLDIDVLGALRMHRMPYVYDHEELFRSRRSDTIGWWVGTIDDE